MAWLGFRTRCWGMARESARMVGRKTEFAGLAAGGVTRSTSVTVAEPVTMVEATRKKSVTIQC